MSVRWLKPTGVHGPGRMRAGCGRQYRGASAREPHREHCFGTAHPAGRRRRTVGRPAARSSVTVRVYMAPRGGLTPLEGRRGRHLDARQRVLRPVPDARAIPPHLGPDGLQRVRSVKAWLKGAGLHVDRRRGANRDTCAPPGHQAAAGGRAFGTKLERFRHSGQTVHAPADSVTVPCRREGPKRARRDRRARLDHSKTPAARRPRRRRPGSPRPPVLALLGQVRQVPGRLPHPAAEVQRHDPATPRVATTGPQFRAAYEGDTPTSTARRTVAITDAYAAPTIAQDANKYARGTVTAVRARPVHPDASRRSSPAGRVRVRPAGTARRRSTSRPCTRWPRARTSATTARRAASTTTSSPRSRRVVDDERA